MQEAGLQMYTVYISGSATCGKECMKQYEAIYVRQSVDRPDSISTESQVEICKKEVTEGAEYKVYTDKGFSGKNTERPAFQELLKDILAGKVSRIIVYRLDRMTRSVLDFANIIVLLKDHNVSFASTMEKFDTATPLGNAMLMIVMVFAQLERETIQQRVKDAYISRSKRGFYMGGRVPYGFTLVNTNIDGIRTKMFEPVEEELKVVSLIFEMYAEPQTSFGDIVKFLNENGIRNRDGKAFSRSRIRDIVINPIYVRADGRIFDFFKSQGTEIVNPPEHFVGMNGAYLYSGNQLKRKTVSLKGHTLVLAPHKGEIDSATWIQCRTKCLNNQQVAKPNKAKATWLAGKIKCGHCGYALVAKTYHCKTKEDNRYFICSHKYSAKDCDFGSLDADEVEATIFDEMTKKLEEFSTLQEHQEVSCNLEVIKLKTRIEQIDKEISALLDKIVEANDTVMKYINERVATLDKEKIALYAECERISVNESKDIGQLTDYMDSWAELSMGDKLTVVDSLISKIVASEDNLKIFWKI